MSEGYVPDPLSSHPHYANHADAIRDHLAPTRKPPADVRVAEPQSLTADWTNPQDMAVSDLVFKVNTLTVKKCAGPAPFVGDPIWQQGWYCWYAAVDDLGRHVAGDSRLDIIERTARA